MKAQGASRFEVLVRCLSITGVSAVVLAASALTAFSNETPEAPAEASCLAANCHAYRMAFQESPHSILDTHEIAKEMGASNSCAACHGEPIRRDKKPGEWGCTFETFSFSQNDLPEQKTRRCLKCHQLHADFGRSPHGRAGMDCTTCHDIHGNNPGRWPLQRTITVQDGSVLDTGLVSVPCFGCHQDVFAEFENSERHRLQEGILDCSSCHDPHRRSQRILLGGTKQQGCAQCHMDTTGPFMFEHGANRIEGCSACHTAHGSPNRHMLTFQNVAELCYSCHATAPSFHVRFTLETVCTNCHSTIHGSNLDPYFLK